MRRLNEHLGVEAEVERVAQERDLPQQAVRVRAVARVQLRQMGAEDAVLDRGQEPVRHVLVERHPALSGHSRLRQPGAQHHVGLAVEDRLDQPRDQGRLVLAVRVQHDHDLGIALQGLQVARLLVPAVADVVRVPDQVDRQAARQLDRVVGRLVVHQDDLVHDLTRDRVDRPLERERRVAGRHHDDDLRLPLRGGRWRGPRRARGRPLRGRQSSRAEGYPRCLAGRVASRGRSAARPAPGLEVGG